MNAITINGHKFTNIEGCLNIYQKATNKVEFIISFVIIAPDGKWLFKNESIKFSILPGNLLQWNNWHSRELPLAKDLFFRFFESDEFSQYVKYNWDINVETYKINVDTGLDGWRHQN